MANHLKLRLTSLVASIATKLNTLYTAIAGKADRNGANATGTWNGAAKTVEGTGLGRLASQNQSNVNLTTASDWHQLPAGASMPFGSSSLGSPRPGQFGALFKAFIQDSGGRSFYIAQGGVFDQDDLYFGIGTNSVLPAWYRFASREWVLANGFLTAEADPVYTADKNNIFRTDDANTTVIANRTGSGYDCDDFDFNGVVRINSATLHAPSNLQPTGGFLFSYKQASNYHMQICYPFESGKYASYRIQTNNVWGAWTRMIVEGDNNSLFNNDAGYITSASIPTNYLTTNTAQSGLTGDKNSTGIWQFAFRTNFWYKDSEGNERMYWGSGTNNNSNGFIFKFANANHAFQIRDLNDDIVFITDSAGTTTTGTLVLSNFVVNTSANIDNIELGYHPTLGAVVQSYNRGTSSYRPLYLAGSTTRVRSLSGTGSRMVVAAADGTLSAQAIPVMPSVGNGTLTVKMNGATVGTFTANQSTNSTIDLGNIGNEIADSGNNYGSATEAYDGLNTQGGLAANIKDINFYGSYTIADDDHTVMFTNLQGNGAYCYLPNPLQTPKGRLLVIGNYSAGGFTVNIYGQWQGGLLYKQLASKMTFYLQNTGTSWVLLMSANNV